MTTKETNKGSQTISHVGVHQTRTDKDFTSDQHTSLFQSIRKSTWCCKDALRDTPRAIYSKKDHIIRWAANTMIKHISREIIIKS